MSRKTDLEQAIVESHDIIHDYERIRQTSDRPEEKLRARRAIDEQWKLIRGYLDEYLLISNGALPTHLTEIAAHFFVPQAAPVADAAPEESKYQVHIEHATGVAIGDGAQVIHPEQPPAVAAPHGEWDTQAVRELLTVALDDSELMALCFDHFAPVYETLGGEMGKNAKIHRLVEYCVRHERVAELVQQVRVRNPAQYRHFRARLARNSGGER